MAAAWVIEYGDERLTLAEIARRNNIPKGTLEYRWYRDGKPPIIEPGSPMVAGSQAAGRKPHGLILDGKSATVADAAAKAGVSTCRVRDRIRDLGPELTISQIRDRKKKERTRPSGPRCDDGPMVTREEAKRLELIPSPTPYEYQLRGVQP